MARPPGRGRRPPPGTRYQPPSRLSDTYGAVDQKLFDVASYYTEQRFQDQYTVAELGDTYETIGAKVRVDPTELARMNPDISAPTAGGAVNVSMQPPTPTPDPKVHLDTAAPIPTEFGELTFPEGWNMAKLRAAISGGGGVMDFVSKQYSGYYTEYGGKGSGIKPPHPYEAMTMEYATSHPAEAQQMYQDYQASGIPTEELPAWPGMPSSHAWEKDPETGQWNRSSQESVFDELYVMNGIDPTDPDMVEWFWGFADEDLLFAGELFDVIDFGPDADEYGGYGAAPSYKSDSSSGRGQKPQRGDYASYLGLSSWSI